MPRCSCGGVLGGVPCHLCPVSVWGFGKCRLFPGQLAPCFACTSSFCDGASSWVGGIGWEGALKWVLSVLFVLILFTRSNLKNCWMAFFLTAQFLSARVCCEPRWSCWAVLGESTRGLLVIPKWTCCCLLCNVSPDPQPPFPNFAVNGHYVSLCSLYCQHGMHRSCTNPSQKRQCLLPASSGRGNGP